MSSVIGYSEFSLRDYSQRRLLLVPAQPRTLMLLCVLSAPETPLHTRCAAGIPDLATLKYLRVYSRSSSALA
jgi:hypothetical protein